MMKVGTLLAALLAVPALSAQAWGQTGPNWMAFSGKLSTNSTPVTGPHNLTFKLFAAATGGSALWTETQSAVQFDNGMVFLQLGTVAANDLDVAYFENGGQLYLEVTVDTTTLSPRLGIGAVPFAKFADKAGDAARLGGRLPSEYALAGSTGGGGITQINTADTSGLTGGGTTSPLSLALKTCAPDQVLQYNGTSWDCATLATGGGSITAGSGISVSGNIVSVQGCPSGQVLKSVGSPGSPLWSCQDVGLARTGGGLSVTVDGIGLATCGAGQTLVSNGTTWACSYALPVYTNTFSCVAGETPIAYAWTGATCSSAANGPCSASSCTVTGSGWVTSNTGSSCSYFQNAGNDGYGNCVRSPATCLGTDRKVTCKLP